MASAAQISAVAKCLGDPTRRAVFERIAREGEMAATSLVKGARVSQPAVSQHLRALREAGLVSERRAGRNVFYSADPRGLAPLIDWLGVHAVFWRERFDNLEKLLAEMDQ